jgi:hypothetical protein
MEFLSTGDFFIPTQSFCAIALSALADIYLTISL